MTKEEAQRILDALDQVAIKCGVIRSQEEVDLIESNAKLMASIKAAEKQRFADMVADAVVRFIDGSSMTCAKMCERLEKLEDVVSKEMAKARERTIPWINADDLPSTTPCSPDPGVAHVAPSTMWNNIGYNIALDPKDSPSGIPFSVALEYLKAGREVRRKGWAPSTSRVQPNGLGGVGGMYVIAGASVYVGDFQPALSDMLATDWEVVPS